MSKYWFENARVGDLLRINGPFGTFFLRNETDVDVFLLATGTGIAPVKAMLDSLKSRPLHQRPRSMTVFWGGRAAEDLYFDIDSVAGAYRYFPVLSRAGADWSGLRGYVQQALLTVTADLRDAAVYACGSEAMIQGAKSLLLQHGLPVKRFYSDAFVCSSK